MSKLIRCLVIILILVISANLSIIHSHAATDASISLVGVSNADGICTHGLMWISYTYTPTTPNGLYPTGDPADTIGIVFTDGYGTLLEAVYGGYPITGEPQTGGATLSLGISDFWHDTVNDIQARPVIVTLYDTNVPFDSPEFGRSGQAVYYDLVANGTVLATARFDPAQVENFCDDLPAIGYPPFQKLKVSLVCGDPTFKMWSIQNLNDYTVRFNWQLKNAEQQGSASALPLPLRPTNYVFTSADPHGSDVLQVYVNGELQDTTGGGNIPCEHAH